MLIMQQIFHRKHVPDYHKKHMSEEEDDSQN